MIIIKILKNLRNGLFENVSNENEDDDITLKRNEEVKIDFDK
jgi:hypothetical protein